MISWLTLAIGFVLGVSFASITFIYKGKEVLLLTEMVSKRLMK